MYANTPDRHALFHSFMRLEVQMLAIASSGNICERPPLVSLKSPNKRAVFAATVLSIFDEFSQCVLPLALL